MSVCGFATMTVPAHAEILTIAGLKPAGSSEFVEVQAIAVDRFGGRDGEELSFELEKKLSDIAIFDQPYFDVVNDRSAIEPEITLRGLVTSGVDEFETTEKRTRCVQRNDDDECTLRKDVNVNCIKRVVEVLAQVRAEDYTDGRNIYSKSFPRESSQSICFGDDKEFKSSTSVIRGLISGVAFAVRRELAPTQYQREVRVLESRKKMEKADKKFFKAAIKMTKSNEDEACRMWDEAGANGLVHVSLAFNRALCAEKRGDLDYAMKLYGEARALSPNKYEISESIDRATEYQRAMDEWNRRQSKLSGEVAAKQG